MPISVPDQIRMLRQEYEGVLPEKEMKVGGRGEVTIPRASRDRFGFVPGTEVDFVVDEGGLKLVKSGQRRKAHIDRLYGGKRLAESTDELMRLLRD